MWFENLITKPSLRILYLHQYFALPTSAGGTRSYEFTRRLVAGGHTVHVITSNAMLPTPYHAIKKIQRVTIDGINITIVPQPYSNEMGFLQRIWAFFSFGIKASIQVIRQPTDVIFATSTPLTIALPGLVGRLWHRKPMVFEVRDLWPELPIAVGALKNPICRRLARWLEWIAYHGAKHIIALSPGMAEGVINRGISPERVTVIPNSCDSDVFDIPRSRGDWVRERLHLAADEPLVIYTGAFGLINGVEYLVDIAHAMFNINPRIHFLLVGSGKQRPIIEARATEFGVLGRNLSIWEPLPKVEIVEVLAAATVATTLFLPIKSMENNSANKFFDALAAGKPIAINYGGWQKDILEKSGAGIALSPNNPQVAAEQLAEFVTDTARLLQAQGSARELAQSRFSRDKLFETFENVILKSSNLSS